MKKKQVSIKRKLKTSTDNETCWCFDAKLDNITNNELEQVATLIVLLLVDVLHGTKKDLTELASKVRATHNDIYGAKYDDTISDLWLSLSWKDDTFIPSLSNENVLTDDAKEFIHEEFEKFKKSKRSDENE